MRRRLEAQPESPSWVEGEKAAVQPRAGGRAHDLGEGGFPAGPLRKYGPPALLILLVLTGALVAQGAVGDQKGPSFPLSSTDSTPEGALALARWLEHLGYQVAREGPRSGTDVQFVLEPVRPFEPEESRALLGWVERGGTLVYVPSRIQLESLLPERQRADPLREGLGLQARPGPLPGNAEGWRAFFTAPPAGKFSLTGFTRLEWSDQGWVPLVFTTAGGEVLAATRQMGAGRVYVSATGSFFSNAGILEEDNRALVLNILARHAAGGKIAFEEAHHSLVARPELLETARTSPWGWGIGYASVITFAFLVWGGRRFGPALIPDRPPQRGTGEYVTAYAGLLQRAGAARWAQEQYAQLFRARLARHLGTGAEATAEQLALLYADRYRREPAAVEVPLQALEGPPLGERGLLSQVRDLEDALAVAAVLPVRRDDRG